MIKVKAQQRLLKFSKNGEGELRYVLAAELYSRLSADKVIKQASRNSGIAKGAINAAWQAIGDVIADWATEGHSVAIPGLGFMRFGIRANSVKNVDDVSTDLIRTRRVIFTPNTDIKQELANTNISISCYDVNGNEVKTVTANDDKTVEDEDEELTPEPDPNNNKKN